MSGCWWRAPAKGLHALCVLYLGMAWHILSARSLPVWLGWVSLVIGILALAGPLGFLAFVLFIPYTFTLGILVYRRAPAADSG